MIRTHRYPVDCWSWEFPRGFAESGMSMKRNALRELEEETGLMGRTPVLMGEILPNTGLLSTRVGVFWVEVREDSKVRLQQEEAIERLSFFSPLELRRKLEQGKIRD